MSVQEILLKSGFSPQCPRVSPVIGDEKLIVNQQVPGVPAVPGKNSKVAKGFTARLLALAKLEHYDEQMVHRLTAADLADCIGASDETLVAYLQCLEDTARREAGRLPRGHRGAIFCRHCGPVFVDNDVARVLPKVNGWPTAIGCPWCHIRGRNFPRPSVQSVTCTHWQPGEGSSYASGNCECGHHYPNELHRCDQFRPEGEQ